MSYSGGVFCIVLNLATYVFLCLAFGYLFRMDICQTTRMAALLQN